MLDRSRRSLAQAAGISPGYLRAIETGSNPKTQRPSRPSAPVVARIATALDLPVGELLDLAGYAADDLLRIGLTDDQADLGPFKELADRILAAFAQAIADQRGRFLMQCMADSGRRFSAELGAAASGTFRCAPDAEPRLTKASLGTCTRTLHAVSYEDEQWWGGDHGRAYLQLHEDLAQRGVEMTRVFLIPLNARDENFERTLDRHREIGIETYLLDPDDVPEPHRRDFMLYDDSLLRQAYRIAGRIEKNAEFIDDPALLSRARDDFHQVLDTARSMSPGGGA